MHLSCNGIKYNVSKGAVARGGEELGIIWQRIRTWQGRMTRCSHDVASVENQEDGGRERDVTIVVSEYCYCCFSQMFPCFFFFQKFTSSI